MDASEWDHVQRRLCSDLTAVAAKSLRRTTAKEPLHGVFEPGVQASDAVQLYDACRTMLCRDEPAIAAIPPWILAPLAVMKDICTGSTQWTPPAESVEPIKFPVSGVASIDPRLVMVRKRLSSGYFGHVYEVGLVHRPGQTFAAKFMIRDGSEQDEVLREVAAARLATAPRHGEQCHHVVGLTGIAMVNLSDLENAPSSPATDGSRSSSDLPASLGFPSKSSEMRIGVLFPRLRMSLQHWLSKPRTVGMQLRLRFVRDLARGLRFLHSPVRVQADIPTDADARRVHLPWQSNDSSPWMLAQVIHRDLKPANVLLDSLTSETP